MPRVIKKARRKLATLTPEQDKVWVSLFTLNVNNGMTELQADEDAWQGLTEQFPELKKFDGAKPR